MNNLQIIERNNKRVLTTQQIAESYGTETKVISNNFNRNTERYVEGIHYHKLEGEQKREFLNLHQIEDGSKNAQYLYLWTEKGALLHAKSLNTDQAWQVYEMLVDTYFKAIEQQKPKLPQSYLEALKELVATTEEKEQLQLQIEKDKPKVLFADAVTTSKTTILIGELAKIIKQNGINIGQNRLFEWLREKEYLIRRKGTDYNMPTQKSMDLKLFEVKETTTVRSDGHIQVNKTPKVTGKGQVYFINKFKEVIV